MNSFPSFIRRSLLLTSLLVGLTAGHAAFAADPAIPTAGLTSTEIVFGRAASFSGPSQNLGKQMRLGFEAQFRKINDEGGIYGRKIKVLEFDDAGDAAKTYEGTSILVKKYDVFGILSPTGTRSTKSILPLINEAKIPLIGPYTGDNELNGTFNRYVFHVQASYLDQVNALAEHAANAGLKRVAVVFQDDVDDPKVGQAMVDALKKRNITPVSVETLDKEASTDVLTGVSKRLIEQKADGVLALGSYKPLAAIVKQVLAGNPLVNFFVVPTAGTVVMARELGAQSYGLVTTQVIPMPFNLTYDVTTEYRALLDKYYPKEQATFTGVQGFITAKIVTEALVRTGAAPTREKFIAAMESLKAYDVGGFVVTYGPNQRAGSKYVDLVMIGKSSEDKNNPRQWLGGSSFEGFVD